MNEFIIELQAKLDEAKSKENVNDDIDKLQTQLDKLKIKAEIDPKTISNLTKQLENIIGQKIVISNIGVDQNNITKAAQQTGKQIVNSINKEIESAGTVTNKILRDFSELNNAKRKFVDDHDLISKEEISDAERFYSTIKQAFSEFGQVTVTKGSLEDGTLESMRVKIQQVNGELKTTRDFMLYLNKNDDFGNGFKLVDDDTIRTSEKLIQHLNEEKNIINATGDEIEAQKQKLAEQEKYYKNIKNEVNNLYNLKTKLLSADELQTAELEKQIKQTKERISYNNKQIDKKDLRDNSLDRQINDLEVAKQKQLDLANARLQDASNTKEITKALRERQAIESKLSSGDYDKKFKQLVSSYEKLGLTSDEVKSKTNEVSLALEKLKKNNLDTLVKDEQEFADALKKSQNEAAILKTDLDSIYNPKKQMKLSNDIQDWLSKNSRASKEAKESLNAYYRELSGGRVSVNRLNYIEQELKNVDSLQRKLGKLGKNLKDQFVEAGQSFTQWLSVSSGIMALIYQLQKIPKEVYEIDTAMTNLYKATDETDKKYEQFLSSASDSAYDLGRSISSLVEQTANWAKLGFSLDEAEKLAKISSIYANVGEVDNDTAVSDMVTAMKAFNIEASDSITIVDKLNKLGNEYATSAADLGEGLSRSASAMATSGTDINKTLAMLTGGVEITQNASEFGNFLKVGSMRIRGMKGQLEELGEEVDETVDSISKVQTQILNRTGGKVNIFDDLGNFRDYYDIMEDIAEVYDDLSSTDQADLTEILFGKQRGNQGAALIQAFQSGQIQKALEATLNAEGSAMQEQERWMGSLEAKTQQFEAAFQSLSSTVLDSDLLKWFVDFGTGAVKVLDTVIDKIGSLGTIGLAGVGYGISSIIKNLDCQKVLKIA